MLYDCCHMFGSRVELDTSEQYRAFEYTKADPIPKEGFRRAIAATWALRSASKDAVYESILGSEGAPYRA